MKWRELCERIAEIEERTSVDVGEFELIVEGYDVDGKFGVTSCSPDIHVRRITIWAELPTDYSWEGGE